MTKYIKHDNNVLICNEYTKTLNIDIYACIHDIKYSQSFKDNYPIKLYYCDKKIRHCKTAPYNNYNIYFYYNANTKYYLISESTLLLISSVGISALRASSSRRIISIASSLSTLLSISS